MQQHEIVPSSSDSVLDNSLSGQNCTPMYARVKHAFKGRNNDELTFRKGDIITVTQQLDGGWWEGTLNSSTGWFPSNYVTTIPESERFLRSNNSVCSVFTNGGETLPRNEKEPLSFSGVSSRQAYRKQVVENFLDTETRYVENIRDFQDKNLTQIKNSGILSDDEFRILSGNLELLIVQQGEILNKIKDAVRNDPLQARIGGTLLRFAPILRQLLRFYCENHPQAVDLVLKKRAELDGILKDLSCESKDLISGLSQPFRHLDTYPNTLNELEHGIHEAHPDRGDTIRAAAVFRDIMHYCTDVRKQKEVQLEFRNYGSVDGLVADEMTKWGEIIWMGIVSVDDVKASTDEGLFCDRCLVLFSSLLLILEITSNVNSYILKKKVLLEGMVLKKAENKLTLQLCNSDGVTLIALNLLSNFELQSWAESFALCEGLNIDDMCCAVVAPCAPQAIDAVDLHNMAEISPLRKAEVLHLPASVKAFNAKKNVLASAGLRFDHDLEMVLPEEDTEIAKGTSSSSNRAPMYSGYCLRPYPLARGNYAVDYSTKANVKMRKEG